MRIWGDTACDLVLIQLVPILFFMVPLPPSSGRDCGASAAVIKFFRDLDICAVREAILGAVC